MRLIWHDRNGRRLELESPAPIEAEAEEIAQQIDDLVDLLESADRLIRNTARESITTCQQRLEQLNEDGARWNHHVMLATKDAAGELVRHIDDLPTILADVLLVVALHGEHEQLIEETAGEPVLRQERLSKSITGIQQQAVEVCGSRSPPPMTATRAEIKAWLDRQPRFARQPYADDGWFAWTDRNGHAQRLTDPLLIECEIAAIAGELRDLKPELNPSGGPESLYAAVKRASASLERLKVLKCDLKRFDREADAHDLTVGKTYAADWRSKRKK